MTRDFANECSKSRDIYYHVAKTSLGRISSLPKTKQQLRRAEKYKTSDRNHKPATEGIEESESRCWTATGDYQWCVLPNYQQRNRKTSDCYHWKCFDEEGVPLPQK